VAPQDPDVSKGAISAVPEIRSPPTKLQEADRAPRAAMDEEKREKFLAALAELGELFAERVYTVFYETWMRKGSLQAMTLRWIDWKAETITMPAAYNKSRKEKVIDLAPRAATAIRAQLAANAAARAPDAPVPLDEPIFGPFDFHQAKTQVVTLKDGTKKTLPGRRRFWPRLPQGWNRHLRPDHPPPRPAHRHDHRRRQARRDARRHDGPGGHRYRVDHRGSLPAPEPGRRPAHHPRDLILHTACTLLRVKTLWMVAAGGLEPPTCGL
jgi:hypothetical protein